MSCNATTEQLSAYLDQELSAEEASELESLIEDCPECHARLEGLRHVMHAMGRVERLAPPPNLDMAVARRIALAGQKKTLLDRFEDRLSAFQRQPSMMLWFCLVFALVMVTFFFLNSLERSRHSNIPVVFESDDVQVIAQDGSRVELAGRAFEKDTELGVWRQVVQPTSVAVEGAAVFHFTVGSPEHTALLEGHPELAELQVLEEPVWVWVGGGWIVLER